MKVNVEFKVLFLKSFTIAAKRSNLCIETITAQVNAIRRVNLKV